MGIVRAIGRRGAAWHADGQTRRLHTLPCSWAEKTPDLVDPSLIPKV